MFSSMKHTTMSRNRVDSLSVVYLKAVLLALLAVGSWEEDIVLSLQVSVLACTTTSHHKRTSTTELLLFLLGVDNVLEFTIVLANDTLVTTNAYQSPDLFWALRGVGGTYGVVLSTTYQTHPKQPPPFKSTSPRSQSPNLLSPNSFGFTPTSPMLIGAPTHGCSLNLWWPCSPRQMSPSTTPTRSLSRFVGVG